MRVDTSLFTLETTRGDFSVPDGSQFVYRGDSNEARAQIDSGHLSSLQVKPENGVAIIDEHEDWFIYAEPVSGTTRVVDLHEPDSIKEFITTLGQDAYLDITGLTHQTWAPLLREAINLKSAPTVVYVEPLEYARVDQPTAGRLFNLSDSVKGIAPLPGFARITRDSDRIPAFVPLLGFEGPRLSFVMDQTEIDLVNTHPIMGMPGFRPEYLSYSYKGNHEQLTREYMHSRVHFAKANCPFDAFLALEEIDSLTGKGDIRVAPIGTKPHGLGAVLFAISRGDRVEVIYDHPVRSRARTVGEARMCIYDLPSFLETPMYAN